MGKHYVQLTVEERAATMMVKANSWHQFKIVHLCQLNFDSGSNAEIAMSGCG